MIRINLLPARKAKRAQAEPGSKELVLGLFALAGAGVLVWLFVDKPKRDHLAELQSSTKEIVAQMVPKKEALKGYDAMKTAADEAAKRAESIDRLIGAKVVPANILHELGEILFTGHTPTMTEKMIKLTGPSLTEGDPNKHFQTDWDPTHVWLSSFTDSGGTFKLEGGAQNDGDVTQLSKRLQASVYFDNVNLTGGERITDQASNVTYYKFTITGKLAY